mmetsp:Transcript_22184/g.52770  ORF Transcript_22184/g.52770 Transcript_22184/m.52770 type:complete len:229 (-) Transcript_22184:297-983(-)
MQSFTSVTGMESPSKSTVNFREISSGRHSHRPGSMLSVQEPRVVEDSGEPSRCTRSWFNLKSSKGLRASDVWQSSFATLASTSLESSVSKPERSSQICCNRALTRSLWLGPESRSDWASCKGTRMRRITSPKHPCSCFDSASSSLLWLELLVGLERKYMKRPHQTSIADSTRMFVLPSSATEMVVTHAVRTDGRVLLHMSMSSASRVLLVIAKSSSASPDPPVPRLLR